MTFHTAALVPVLLAGLYHHAALAQAGADAQAVWDRFAEDCGALVEAADPAMFAVSQASGTGEAGQSADDLVSVSTQVLDDLPLGHGTAVLHVIVNAFPDGRSVQCMLQLPQPDPALAALDGIARQHASALLGSGMVMAGGPLAAPELAEREGMPSGIDAQDVTFLRFSSGEFPPDAMLIVQVMPMFISLTYGVTQPADD